MASPTSFSTAIPSTRPHSSITGPPLLPGLMAASVCTSVPSVGSSSVLDSTPVTSEAEVAPTG